MAKTKIDSRGVVTTPGTGTTIAGIVTLNSGIKSTPKAKLLDFTVSTGGVYTIDGDGNGALTAILPLAASVPGSMLTFRCASADAHIITASNVVTQDDTIICTTFVSGAHGAVSGLAGSQIALPAVIGSSVTFFSDGFNFCVVAAKGTPVITTPSA